MARFRPFEVFPDGTYELCGPKLQGNPEGFAEHTLVRHGTEVVDPPRTWDGLRDFLASYDGEGIVFHHPDGRMRGTTPHPSVALPCARPDSIGVKSCRSGSGRGCNLSRAGLASPLGFDSRIRRNILKVSIE